ncbi:hypothetical protein GQ43DRAFT_291648 [Delitschia confertaspora ATCC 74209]|uniref:Digeranylgeranylglyceryl phosphate synthase n=1 Tax=Delitschia confertaspora ATCC 74209 TaxID=1513339 RepID=A0A9P4JRE0_9PLEO|nr:hypothetical protein GQ43DRAFT_291648 [Delitschia confertaspora ATCC 74209]
MISKFQTNLNGPPRLISKILEEGVDFHHLSGFLGYHLYSIWLFTFSDLKTIVIPKTIFGTMSAFAAPVFNLSVYSNHSEICSRIPLAALWVYINFLPFAIDNQRQTSSIEEDRLNKPWRTMPSGRMTKSQANILMCCLYPIAVFASWRIGGMMQSLSLIALGFWYNDMGGADKSCITRNLINALGYVCFSSGAMEAALGQPLLTIPTNTLISAYETVISSVLCQWFAIIAGVVFTTVHSQDLYDQAGDSAIGRRSVPLVIGDFPARVIVAVFMLFWSFFIPRFWRTTLLSTMLVGGLGLAVVIRILAFRNVRSDRKTFLMWNIWVVSLYMLPILKMYDSGLTQ